MLSQQTTVSGASRARRRMPAASTPSVRLRRIGMGDVVADAGVGEVEVGLAGFWL